MQKNIRERKERKRLGNRDLEKNMKQNRETHPGFTGSRCWGGIWGALRALQRMLPSSTQAAVHNTGNSSDCKWDCAGDASSQFGYHMKGNSSKKRKQNRKRDSVSSCRLQKRSDFF